MKNLVFYLGRCASATLAWKKSRHIGIFKTRSLCFLSSPSWMVHLENISLTFMKQPLAEVAWLQLLKCGLYAHECLEASPVNEAAKRKKTMNLVVLYSLWMLVGWVMEDLCCQIQFKDFLKRGVPGWHSW